MNSGFVPTGSRELFRRLRQNWMRFLAIHLAVTALVVAILMPAAGLLLRLAVRLSGSAALSDTDILFFALSPAGFISLLILGSIFSIVILLEYAALLVIAWSIDTGRHVSTLQALWVLVDRSASLFRLVLRILVRVLLNLLPFAGLLGVVYLWLLTEYDINYYLAERPPEWQLALALGAVIGAAAVINLLRLFLNWIFCLPLLLFSGCGPAQALSDSRQAVGGHRVRIGVRLGLWLAVSMLLTAGVSASLSLIGMYVIPLAVTSVKTLLPALGLISLSGFALYVLVGCATSAWLSLLIVSLFGERLPRRGAPLEVRPGTAGGRPQRVSGRLLAWAFALGLVAALALTYMLLERLKFSTATEVVAHRGASAAAPENTLAAVKAAIEAGAHWVEIDVQETADDEIVVIHDSDLKKVGGSPLSVTRSPLGQLRAVDVGSWFGPEFADQRIPTLEEVLELCRGRAGVIIELKYYGGERALERRVIEIVERLGMEDQVKAMSLSYKGIQTLHRQRPDWTVGLLSSVAMGRLAALDVDFLALNGRAATRSLVRQAHRHGKQVMVWTVNDAVTMATMMGRGADALITDEPALAASMLEEFEQLEPSQRLLIQLADLFDRPGLYVEQ